MTSTFTPNLGIEIPARGDYVGTWDTPTDTTFNTLDTAYGSTLSLGLTAGSLTLTKAQASNPFISFTVNLVGNQSVHFPAIAGKRLIQFSGTFSSYAVQIVGASDSIGVTISGKNRFPGSPPLGIVVTSSRVYWEGYETSPPGTVINWTAAPQVLIPPGWLVCDGSLYSVTQYDLLFAVIGYNYGGSGSSFGVPDYRGYVTAGADDMGTGPAGRLHNWTLNITGGEAAHQLITSEIPLGSIGLPSSTPTDYLVGSTTPAVAHNNIQPTRTVIKLIRY